MPYVLIDAHPKDRKSRIIEVGDWPVIMAYLRGRYHKQKDRTPRLNTYQDCLRYGVCKCVRVEYRDTWYQIEYRRKHVECGPCDWPIKD